MIEEDSEVNNRGIVAAIPSGRPLPAVENMVFLLQVLLAIAFLRRHN
jgi:hypothetical protein